MEIGPGPGILTQGLAAHAEVIALELDDRMVAAAQAFAPTAQIRQQDALAADWLSVLRELPEPTGIVSNMPYNITGPLLTRVAACRQVISGAVLMMQREVGDKILAAAGKRERGSLSVELQAKFEIKRVCLVPPGSFLPPPKVESIVLALTPRSGIDPAWDEPDLLGFVRQGFQQPRKTLFNNLRPVADGERVRDAMMKEGLAETARPHELETDAWLRLHQSIRNG